MNAVELVDSALSGPALVTGALPPEGRDLDVWLTDERLEEVTRALRAEGFVARGATWARFAPLELVDLELLGDESMLARATPLPSCRHLSRPDPADALRLLAAAFRADGQVTPSRRARADQPAEVWREAAARGDATALSALQEALAAPDPAPALAHRVRGRLRRMARAGVVTLSGVDGSGKSTQAERLEETLSRAGFEVAVEWNRLSHDRWLDALARPVKRLLRRGPEVAREPTGGSGAGTPRGVRGLWVVVVALANAVAHNRSVRGHLLAGRVVICDRYTLDSTVQLSTDYPPGLGQRIAVRLVRWLSPRPVASFYLALPPEVAGARKEWEGSPERLHRHAGAYEQHWSQLGVRRVDATRPADEVAAEIATQVWCRL